MSAVNSYFRRLSFGLVIGLVIGLVVGSVIGSTETDNELTKGRVKDWSSSEKVSSSSLSLSSSSSSLSSSSSSNDDGYRIRRSATEDKAKMWPISQVPYVISDEIDRVVKPRILEAIDLYHEMTCIRFINGTEEEFERNRTVGNMERNYVRFIPGSRRDICSSPVGMTLGRKALEITLGITCTLSDIIHEMGHLLGLLHEQSRADRDANVVIQWSDIKTGMTGNFYKSDLMQWLGPYDLSSIMHYTPQTFSVNGNPVFTPIYVTRVQVQDRRRLSFYDALKLNKLYQCAAHCNVSETITCENGGYLNEFCACVCPKSLVGDRCQLPANSAKCGKVIELPTLAKKTFTSLNFPSNYPSNISCTWIIKAPIGFHITLSLDQFDIGCSDNLEIRYHYIGIELEPRSCVNSTNLVESRTLESTTNRMVLNFQSNSGGEKKRSGFRATVKATPNIDCASSPCLQNATCRDVADIETYFCACPDRWIGKNCELEVKDGEWSTWSSWSGCNAQCGYEDRKRECGIPPINGGKECHGVRKETKRCGREGAYQGQCQDHYHCDFGDESNQTTCGIVQEKTRDDFDWGTQSWHRAMMNHDWHLLTGHTTRRSEDVFFHMDGSHGKNYHIAIFWLPRLLASTGRYCLQFFYHMTGRWMGLLSVVRETRRSSRVIWQASGNRSNAWHRANINVLLYDGVQIGFHGVRGDGADSDIAVDDITLSPTGCYVNHLGTRLIRLPITHRRTHACFRGDHRYRVGNVSYIEDCNQFVCHCNHDGSLDCPAWLVTKVCTNPPTSSP